MNKVLCWFVTLWKCFRITDWGIFICTIILSPAGFFALSVGLVLLYPRQIALGPEWELGINLIGGVLIGIFGAMLERAWAKHQPNELTGRATVAVRSLGLALSELERLQVSLAGIETANAKSPELVSTLLNEIKNSPQRLSEFVLLSIQNWTGITPTEVMQETLSRFNVVDLEKKKLQLVVEVLTNQSQQKSKLAEQLATSIDDIQEQLVQVTQERDRLESKIKKSSAHESFLTSVLNRDPSGVNHPVTNDLLFDSPMLRAYESASKSKNPIAEALAMPLKNYKQR